MRHEAIQGVVPVRSAEMPFAYELVQRPLSTIENQESVIGSLEVYKNYMNATGEIDILMETHKKQYRETPEGNFVMSPPLQGWCSRLNKEYGGYCYKDEEYGLAIGINRPNEKRPLWLAMTSFSYDEDGPMIKQIQAYTNEFYNEYMAQQDILAKYRWEFAIINSVALWAKRVNLGKLHLVGGENNAYKDTLGEERVHMRYDVTAKRLGFVPNGNSGNYVLSLR